MYKQIRHQHDVANGLQQIKQSFTNPFLWLSILLVFFNWGIEAIKWQLLLKPLTKISFTNAYKSVLAGCSITMLTPNRVGEYGGRILYIEDKYKLDAIPLTILGSVSQLFITILMGIFGLLYFIAKQNNVALFNILPSYASNVLLAISIAAAVTLILLYFRVGLIVNWLKKFSIFKKVVSHIVLLNTFSRKQLLRILFLSFFRYAIFILQYVMLLKAMQVQIDVVICFWLLTIFYLIMAVAPTIGFTELPIRASAALGLLKVYSSNTVGIEAASLSIWMINLVFPAIVGSLFILGIKILKEK